MKRTLSNRQLPDSALKYLLEALIPYSEANLKLAFKPGLFFNDLENISKQKRITKASYKNAYYKALRDGFIGLDNRSQPLVTKKGKEILQVFKPKILPKGACLMVVFDIPEAKRAQRTYLRIVLREFKFRQVQKSVWVSKYDSKEYLVDELSKQGISEYALLYEAAQIPTT